ncbi:MAG: hypothetical protein FWD71_14475 [Oscillospiraceae bacterium]|nr:hypothetical protein [Oscillospiraceae bacterium]
MGIQTYENSETESTKSHMKYKDYNYPVLLVDSNLIVTYKNNAARFANIKPRLGMNMEKYADPENIKKLRDTQYSEKINTIKLDIQSNIKYCLSKFESEDAVMALIFYDSLNFIKDSDDKIFGRLNDIISKYSPEFSDVYEDADISDNVGYENDKKILRLREHLRRHMSNIYLYDYDKIYCDIGAFMRKFSGGILPYISNLGYKIFFDIEDNMFMYKLNESDFLTVNFILTAFALEYSVFGKVNVKFVADSWSSNHTLGILRYEFTVPRDFERTHRNMFIKDYQEDIGGIEYLDLSLTALIAKNNNMKTNVRFNEDNGSKVHIDLIFDSNYANCELNSPIWQCYSDNSTIITVISAESVKKQADIEFSILKLPSLQAII